MQIPQRSPPVISFYDLLSPAPSTCSVESTEALLRDLVDVYNEPIAATPPSSSPENFTDETQLSFPDQAVVHQEEPLVNQIADEYLMPVKQETTVNHTSTYPLELQLQDQGFLPSLPNYPTGGPPETSEPSLLSSVAARSKPLEEALQSECSANILPLSLIQAAATQDTQFPAPIPLATRSAMLQTKLLSLETTHKTKVDRLHLFYQLQAARIESDRTNQLCASIHAPNVLPYVNRYFEMQYHALIDNIELQLHCLQYQFSPCNSITSSSGSTCSVHQSSLDAQLPSSTRHCQRQKKTKPPPLNKLAIRIMTNWYQRNIDHPYPSNDSAEIMAKAGNITAEQVKKWFANKRMRNANTKPQRAAAAAKAGSRPLDDGHIMDQPPSKKIRLY